MIKNDNHMKLSKAFKQVVDQVINNYIQDPVKGRAIEELVVTDLTENGFIDEEFNDVLYKADGEIDFAAEQQVHDMVTAYVKDALIESEQLAEQAVYDDMIAFEERFMNSMMR